MIKKLLNLYLLYSIIFIFCIIYFIFILLQDYAVSRLKNYQYLKEKITVCGSPTIDNIDIAKKETVVDWTNRVQIVTI